MSQKQRIYQDYSSLSVGITNTISKTEKKNNGIYFTPQRTIKRNIELLSPYIKSMKTVLEPSCGSCEYIQYLSQTYPNLSISGIEYNKTIFDSIQHLKSERIHLENSDFLASNSEKSYDLIIGNPPYYVMKKSDVPKSYYKYFDGRPNIFILFLIKSFSCLRKNGILSFILPKNFLNSLYYDKTRKYISERFHIIHISECNDQYMETAQDTILFIVQKRSSENNNPFLLNLSTYTIFAEPVKIQRLQELYEHSLTLSKLGFDVKVGTVVWNECKQILTNDNRETLLIYSSDIKNRQLDIQTYNNVAKKNYIHKPGNTEPVLVINRGYGTGEYKFEYCLIDMSREYLIENHLICVVHKHSLERPKLMELYKQVMNSFQNEKTKEFISLYFGNNAINTTELCEILPIYV